MSGMSLAAVSFEYALDRGRKPLPKRRARKLCAPCCWMVAAVPAKYCDEIAVPGETYCQAHKEIAAAAKAPKPAKPNLFTLPARLTAWRSREM